MTNCKTKKEAEQRGRKLLKMMKSKGWTLDVWHNLVWCYGLRSEENLLDSLAIPSIHPDQQHGKPTTYSAIFNGIGAHPCSDEFTDPNKAVEQLVLRADRWQKEHAKRWERFLEHHGLNVGRVKLKRKRSEA